jgi:hypothetical protein
MLYFIKKTTYIIFVFSLKLKKEKKKEKKKEEEKKEQTNMVL